MPCEDTPLPQAEIISLDFSAKTRQNLKKDTSAFKLKPLKRS